MISSYDKFAVTTATINVVGGFIITRRMLAMFKRSTPARSESARSEHTSA